MDILCLKLNIILLYHLCDALFNWTVLTEDVFIDTRC